MKKYLTITVLALILVSGTALAKENDKDPFTLIWNAIASLQHEIDTIQLLPGPQGPQGEQGPVGATSTVPGPVGPQRPQGEMGTSSTIPGPQGEIGEASTVPGPKGDKGDSGGSLHAFDANGQDLGLLMNINASVRNVTTYLPDTGIFIELEQSGRALRILNNSVIWFTEENCTGNPYGGYGNPGATIINNGRAFKSVEGLSVNDDSFFKSRLVESCSNYQGGPGLGMPMEEVVLPFSLPLKWPLEIR